MTSPDTQPNRRKARIWIGSILTAVAVLAGSALAFAHGMGGGWHHDGMDTEEMVEHLQVHVQHVLAEVNASPEQQAKIKNIVTAATTDLQKLRAEHGDARRELHELFTAPTIDREKLESVRADHMAALETASKRVTAALADAADVLTPEQRSQLGEKLAKRHAAF